MRTTTNAGLTVWDLSLDLFDHNELAADWDGVDAYFVGFDPTSKLVRKMHQVTSVPGSGSAGETVMLSVANGTYPAYTILKHNGTRWLPVGYEIQSTVPGSNNFLGRLLILTTDNSGFSAGDVLYHDGSNWHLAGRFHEVSEGSYPKISGVRTIDNDVYIDSVTKGLILKDRTTTTRYRVYIDNGTLEFESAE